MRLWTVILLEGAMRGCGLSMTFSVHLYGRLDDGLLVENGAVIFASEESALACAHSLEDDVEGICVKAQFVDQASGRRLPADIVYSRGLGQRHQRATHTVH
jgi:hypothetical protein